MDPNLNCRICGYEWDAPPWGESGRLPIFELCPCCFVETGYEDFNEESTRAYREAWISRGAPWSIVLIPHDGLTTEERLTNVPPGFE